MYAFLRMIQISAGLEELHLPIPRLSNDWTLQPEFYISLH